MLVHFCPMLVHFCPMLVHFCPMLVHFYPMLVHFCPMLKLAPFSGKLSFSGVNPGARPVSA